jgi:hypothetical protein
VPIVLKSGSLSLLEPPGPLQACNGSALHLSMLEWYGTVYISFLSVTVTRFPYFVTQLVEFQSKNSMLEYILVRNVNKWIRSSQIGKKVKFRGGAVQQCSRTGLLYSDPQRISLIHL